MALTKIEKQELEAVLNRTGAHREAGKAVRFVPDDYQSFQDIVIREEVIITVPAVPQAPVKCYITTARNKAAGCPVHVNMHGGGFVFLQDEDDDLYCAHLAARLEGIVVDIDYASSLDHAYPAAFEQCYEVMRWVYDKCQEWGADKKKISMSGHSAGGCLVAAISLKAARTKDFPISLQILDYAAIDNFAPMEDEGAERSRAFSLLYADGDAELLKNPYVSPAFAPSEMLKEQPKTLIINAGSCPFYKVNREYGQRLKEAGAEVKIACFEKSRHGFTIRMVDEWREAQELIISEILAACTPES